MLRGARSCSELLGKARNYSELVGNIREYQTLLAASRMCIARQISLRIFWDHWLVYPLCCEHLLIACRILNC